jgi:hypothetical protein
VGIAAAGLIWAWAVTAAAAETADFKLAWTNVGQVLSRAEKDAVMLQHDVKIARVDVQPTILKVQTGKQVCIGALQVRTFDPDGHPIAAVPLDMAVREDQKLQLRITHTRGVCMRPARQGEYPIRFTSKVPAADDTLRGAQIFLRAT